VCRPWYYSRSSLPKCMHRNQLRINCSVPNECKLWHYNWHQRHRLGGNWFGSLWAIRLQRVGACTVTEQHAWFSILSMLLVLLGYQNTSNMDSMLKQACYSVTVHAPIPLETERADLGGLDCLPGAVQYQVKWSSNSPSSPIGCILGQYPIYCRVSLLDSHSCGAASRRWDWWNRFRTALVLPCVTSLLHACRGQCYYIYLQHVPDYSWTQYSALSLIAGWSKIETHRIDEQTDRVCGECFDFDKMDLHHL
jgi:hypothetical protein